MEDSRFVRLQEYVPMHAFSSKRHGYSQNCTLAKWYLIVLKQARSWEHVAITVT